MTPGVLDYTMLFADTVGQILIKLESANRCEVSEEMVETLDMPILKQGSHLHDLQQDFNKTKTHAVKCEEQVAVLRSEITEPLYAIALRMQHDTNLII